jgi:hypothetical protein
MAFPRTPNEEELFAQMQRGTQAAGASSLIGPMLAERRQRLTQDAVARYRSLKPETKLTERDAFVFVAALTATYDLEDDLNRVINDGSKAGQHFLK